MQFWSFQSVPNITRFLRNVGSTCLAAVFRHCWLVEYLSVYFRGARLQGEYCLCYKTVRTPFVDWCHFKAGVTLVSVSSSITIWLVCSTVTFVSWKSGGVIQGDSLARSPKLLSIKNYVIEIMARKFIYTYREWCKTGPAHNRCWKCTPFYTNNIIFIDDSLRLYIYI